MTTRVPEIVLCAAWHAGDIARHLTTTDGQSLEIVHSGAWSHGLGPDFQNAAILFNDRELRSGSVEMHLSSRGWIDHGHHLDQRYDSVILHVVGSHDRRDIRRSDGALVPTVDVGPVSRFPLPDFAAWDWDRIGGDVCAARSTTDHPELVRAILLRLGDTRIADRAARLESQFTLTPPAQVLRLEILDGLGYSQNRAPMRALGEILPLSVAEDILRSTRYDAQVTLTAVMLGIAGFLPLSPREAHGAGLEPDSTTRIELAWNALDAPFLELAGSVSDCEQVRVRPGNLPIGRIAAAAALLASASRSGGLLPALSAQVQDSSNLVKSFRALTASELTPGIGADRAIDMLASSILPFLLALARYVRDTPLADAAAAHWANLPARQQIIVRIEPPIRLPARQSWAESVPVGRRD